MNYLSPAAYNQAEILACTQKPNRIIECCQPNAFQWGGYPTRIDSIEGAQRYVDVMHEGRLKDTFRDMLEGGVTEEELHMLREVCSVVKSMTKDLYGVEVIPKDALIRALNVYRHISYLYPQNNKTIFEIGPGSGYLGALLLLNGYSYVSTDVAQAFYIFQSHLFNAIAPGKLIELATDKRELSEFSALSMGEVLHIPWWKFVDVNPKFSLEIDLVTANHCLCEMHPHALAYSLKTLSKLLENRSEDGGYFLFEGWGSTVLNKIWTINKKFGEIGYVAAHNDTKASIYVKESSQFAMGAAPKMNTFKKPENERVNFINKLPFFGFQKNVNQQSVGIVTSEDLYHPNIWITESNPVSQTVTSNRKETLKAFFGDVSDYINMLNSLAKSNGLHSQDQLFLEYINLQL